MANESISVLKKETDYRFPEKGKTRTYKLLGMTISENGNLVCPQSSDIPNKFLINDGGIPKSYVYVSHQDPTVRSDSVPESQKGRIVFTRAARGLITIYGGNPTQRFLDEALWFHQNNKSNIGKPWHIRPRTGEYLFEMVDTAKKSEDNIHKTERNSECVKLIQEMSVANLRDIYEILFHDESEGLSVKDVKSALYNHIASDDNAQAFLKLNKSDQVRIRKIINLAFDGKLIEKTEDNSSVIWTKGKELICNRIPRMSLIKSLQMFMVTDEGRDVLKILDDLTKAEETLVT